MTTYNHDRVKVAHKVGCRVEFWSVTGEWLPAIPNWYESHAYRAINRDSEAVAQSKPIPETTQGEDFIDQEKRRQELWLAGFREAFEEIFGPLKKSNGMPPADYVPTPMNETKLRPRKGSWEDIFGHLGTPEEVAAEWDSMKFEIGALRNEARAKETMLLSLSALKEVMSVTNGEIDRHWDALPYKYTGPLYIKETK